MMLKHMNLTEYATRIENATLSVNLIIEFVNWHLTYNIVSDHR